MYFFLVSFIPGARRGRLTEFVAMMRTTTFSARNYTPVVAALDCRCPLPLGYDICFRRLALRRYFPNQVEVYRLDLQRISCDPRWPSVFRCRFDQLLPRGSAPRLLLRFRSRPDGPETRLVTATLGRAWLRHSVADAAPWRWGRAS